MARQDLQGMASELLDAVHNDGALAEALKALLAGLPLVLKALEGVRGGRLPRRGLERVDGLAMARARYTATTVTARYWIELAGHVLVEVRRSWTLDRGGDTYRPPHAPTP